MIFNASAPRPIQSSSRNVRFYLPSRVIVDYAQKIWVWDFFVEERIANIGIPLIVFGFCNFNAF